METTGKYLTIIHESEIALTPSKQQCFLDKLFESARQLDASIVEPWIEEDGNFEIGSKYEFLTNLRNHYQMAHFFGKIVTIEEFETNCEGGKGCKFRDGASPVGMKVKGFRGFREDEPTTVTNPAPRYFSSFGFVLRYQQNALIEIMLCGTINQVPKRSSDA